MTTDEGEIIDFSENRLKELLDTIEEVDGKVIIWCSYRHNIKKVIETLDKKFGPGHGVVSGKLQAQKDQKY